MFEDMPDNWFLDSLCHVHTNTVYVKDKHTPLYWECKLQHTSGGKLVTGKGLTAKQAYLYARNQALDKNQTLDKSACKSIT